MVDHSRMRGFMLCAALAVAAWPATAPAQGTGQDGPEAVERALETLSDAGIGRPSHTLVIDGTGTGTNYTIAGGGALTPVEGRIHGVQAAPEPGDEVRGNRAEGQVLGGADAYLVDGALPDIVLSDPRAADIFVNGEPYHTIVIDGSAGRQGRTAYTITGGGFLQQVDGRLGGLRVNMQQDDTVRGRRAAGVVTTGRDGYRVFGPLPQVRLENPAAAAVIIDQVRRGPGPGGPAPRRRDKVSIEFDTDRMGGDYRNFSLARPRPNLCVRECNADARCEAFTYVPPGVHGPDAHCWLKDTVPSPRRMPGMISGVKRSPLPQHANIDLPGGDYRNFALPRAQPTRCAVACAREAQCAAYTYVPPGRQGPDARCWLKDTVPERRRAEGLVSGVK